MDCKSMVLVLVLGVTGVTQAVLFYPQPSEPGPIEGPNYGDPVFVTPYLDKGNIDEALALTKVKPFKSNVSSYAGFFTVNNSTGSNMFFWYFPAEREPEKAPVVIWLQGGPGASSLYGVFNEIGPFYVKKQRGLKMRNYYWSQVLNVIFIDNPVGTGFSFTKSDQGYVRNEEEVGRDLYNATKQWLQLFPQLARNELYIAGESYAGKYVPALAYTIHMNNPQAKIKVNLKGISMGNGLCSPEHMLQYSDYLYQVGLIDINAKFIFKNNEDKLRKLIQAKQWGKAFEAFDALINGDLISGNSIFYNTTGFRNYFNFLHDSDYSPYGDMIAYLQKDLIRRSLHVGNLTFHTDNTVEKYLRDDILQSVKPWVETLLDSGLYRVLFYNGQLDIIVAYPNTVSFLQALNWSGAKVYKAAPRKPWMVGKDLAGYSKTAKTLTEVLVRDAGHMVPMDQPKWALDLITRFTSNKPLHS